MHIVPLRNFRNVFYDFFSHAHLSACHAVYVVKNERNFTCQRLLKENRGSHKNNSRGGFSPIRHFDSFLLLLSIYRNLFFSALTQIFMMLLFHDDSHDFVFLSSPSISLPMKCFSLHLESEMIMTIYFLSGGFVHAMGRKFSLS